MISHHKIVFIPLNLVLFFLATIFAVAATLLLIFFTTAATDTGSSPASAISLVEGMNTGILGPDQQRWFRFAPAQQSPAAGQSLTLIFSPTSENLAQFISLEIFEANQPQVSDTDGADQMTRLGVGQLLVATNNPAQGKFVWNGRLAGDQVYYILLRNDSDFAIDYWLFSAEVDREPVAARPETGAPQPPAGPEMGLEPGRAIFLTSDLQRGKLRAYSTYWYTFSGDGFSGSERFQPLSFSLFFTPGVDPDSQKVNFRLFSAGEIASWQRGERAEPAHFGAGMAVSRDGDPLTGERIWQGSLLRDGAYFLAIENRAGMEIDFWLFDRDIHHPELGAEPISAPAPAVTPGSAPQTATPLASDRLTGRLDPGQEIWHSFSITDQDDEYFEAAALTMIVTPADGNRIHLVNFELFTAAGVQNWAPGSEAGIRNVGAGSIVQRDDNPWTGERFWSGWIVDNDLYYVRIRNSADIPVDYWLFNGDVYGPELGLNVTN